MQPRVTAILVARNGSDYLNRTLAALASQSRQPDGIAFVDAGSTDGSSALLAAAASRQLVLSSGGPLSSDAPLVAASPIPLVAASAKSSFGSVVDHAVQVAVPETSENDWLWLLEHDSAPEPGALAALLAAVEIAPSVAVAGPKLMRWERTDTIAEYGETMTRFGASVALGENELDQAQRDTESDLLGVAAAGMLVRRTVWSRLGGFDPALPTVDAALDFCVRVRLAGHRVIGVPTARVASAGGPELFGHGSGSAAPSAGAMSRVRRSAQLHRRLVYSRLPALPLHWLSLLPLAIVRSVLQLVRKQPDAIGREVASALGAAFSSKVGPARRVIRRTRTVGWRAIAPLRMSGAAAREHRAQRWTAATPFAGVPERRRASFLNGGGAWTVLVAALVGLVAFGPFLGAAAASGGGLLPLSRDLGLLWSHVGYGWHDVGGGFLGVSDPFIAVLAVLGSVTAWMPSFSIVLLYLAALPLAALGAWWCASRLTERAWPTAVGAVLWAFAPPFLSSLTAGHLGAVLTHLLLPWLVYATVSAARNWAASGAAALLFAAVAASSPLLIPALVVALLGWIAARPRSAHRLVPVLLPTAVLFLPLILTQVSRGNPFGWLAEPGRAVRGSAASVPHLVLGFPDGSLGRWNDIGAVFGLPGSIVVAILLAPLAVLALVAVTLPRGRRALPPLALALLGFVTAVAATRLELTAVGSMTTSTWPAPGLSLFWLGLVGAGVCCLDGIRKGVVAPALVAVFAAACAVVPLLIAPLLGASAVKPTSGDLLPAYVTAQAATRPDLGTLQLYPQGDGSLAASLDRGEGTTLDETSTLVSTANRASASQKALASLAGNLASRSGFDSVAALNSAHVGFILLSDAPANGRAADVYQRAAAALDGNDRLTPIGNTSRGLLWQFDKAAGAAPERASDPLLRSVILGVQGLVFLVALLLAIPSGRGRRRRSVTRSADEDSVSLGEDDNV